MTLTRTILAIVAATLLAISPVSGHAQQPMGSLADLALDWARGRFATPVICQLDGEPVRGRRRILIAPGPAHVHPPVARITFIDLEVENATRCFAELEGDTPNIVGWVHVRLPGRHRPDTAKRDFREAMRRKRGFEFDIVSGSLKLQTVRQPPVPAREVRFARGKASLRDVVKGSDDERLLGEFKSPRKLILELEARDGTRLTFPLYMTDLR